ncbi:MAG TPA: peptidyl-prolyl cis-trans isomerase [Urbifossiella sp.]|nr:peptidyl-prolyl cis-trans isomerase [Urbifossiella sp.]
MDARTPFRWLALLALGMGCHGPDKSVTHVRPQIPVELAGPPVALEAPPLKNDPPLKVVGPPIQGLPVPPDPAGPVAPASLSVPVSQTHNSAARLNARPLAEPRIRFVALIGKNNSVTDEEVREAVKIRYASERRDNSPIPPDKEQAYYEEELRKAIERELIIEEMHVRLKKAKKGNIIDSLADDARKMTDSNFRNMKTRNGIHSEADFQLWLRGQGLTAPILRRSFERQYMANQFVRGMLREKMDSLGLIEIRDYYKNHPEHFSTADHVKWQDIYISFREFENALKTTDAAKVRAAALKHAQAIQLHAAAGEDFAALSKRYDNGLSGQNGGEGNGTERGAIQPPDLEPTVWALKAGQVSAVIETPAGFHIVKVVSRDYAGIKPFDEPVQKEARARLLQEFHEREYKLFVDQLWRAGTVTFPK